MGVKTLRRMRYYSRAFRYVMGNRFPNNLTDTHLGLYDFQEILLTGRCPASELEMQGNSAVAETLMRAKNEACKLIRKGSYECLEKKGNNQKRNIRPTENMSDKKTREKSAEGT